jgi:1,4-dihydroxy-6-naphthoate synthase
MKLTVAISPCPNDTYIFYGLISGKIKIPNIEFEFHFLDIEALNLSVLQNQFNLCKISFAVAPQIATNYDLLSSGSALGKGCGPLLITHNKLPFSLKNEHKVALPGEHTTARFLFNYFYPEHSNVEFLIFSSIEKKLVDKTYDAGVIIHESRFTYQQKGLNEVLDLGSEWEKKLNLPIPLGGIAIAKNLSDDIKSEINAAIRKSIEYADSNFEEALAFCSKYAQEMNREVMLEHIKLYVNNFSKELGVDGKNAISKLFESQANQNSCKFAIPIRFIE